MNESEEQGPPPPGDGIIETRSHSRSRRMANSTGSRSAGASGLPPESPSVANDVPDFTAQLASITAHSARQDAALHTITEQLQRLATNIEGLQYPEDFEYDEEEVDCDQLFMVPNSEPLSCEVNQLDVLMADLPDEMPETPNVAPNADESLLELDEILKTGLQAPEYGPPVSEGVAKSFSNFTNHSLSSEASTSLKNRLKVPENLKSIGVPRLNACIWNGLDARARTSDTRAQFLQQWLGAALSSLARQTDLVWTLAESKKLTKDDVKPLLASMMDSAQCVGQAQREISLRRRVDLKSVRPALAPLCSPDVAISEFLFGDKLEDGLKAAQAASNLVQKPGVMNRPLRRWRPYSSRRGVSLNVRGGPASGMARAPERPSDTAPASSSQPSVSSSSPLEEVSAYAGQISRFYNAWQRLTRSQFILSIVKGYDIKFKSEPVQTSEPRCRLTVKEKDLVGVALRRLVKIGAVEMVTMVMPDQLSHTFYLTVSNYLLVVTP